MVGPTELLLMRGNPNEKEYLCPHGPRFFGSDVPWTKCSFSGRFSKDFLQSQMLWQSPGQSSVQSRAEKAVVLANRLNLRQSPKKRSKVIGTLKAD